MRKPFAPGIGGVLSADIAVPEHERELAFYATILTTGSEPLWRDDLMNNQGTPVIGLGKRVPEYEALPLQWMPHIQVSDVAASVERAVELGASEIMHGKGDDGSSLWAVIVDPSGAAFGLIPEVGAEAVATIDLEKAGRIVWLTLAAQDTTAACHFYSQVIGWTPAPTDVDGVFEMQRPDGVSTAAICPAGTEDQSANGVWILYLPVNDLDESLRLVRASGGEVISGSAAEGQAVIRDPVGVCLGLQAEDKTGSVH